MRNALVVGFAVVLTGMVSQSVLADEFSFEFEWGKIPKCTSGYPNQVPNPIFTLKNVPEAAVEIKFRMKDLDAPMYRHGGGEFKYTAQSRIEPGAFTYKSPCPPSGTHTYRWKAKVLDANGDELAEATAKRKYPE